MALDFPNSPTTGQNYTSGGQSWQWDGTKWIGIGGTFPSGTVMLFYQASAPVGWTQLTTHNDKLLRAVNGVAGGGGGSNTFTSVNAQTVVGNHSLAAAELPSISFSGSATPTFYLNNNSGYYLPMTPNTAWGSSAGFGSGSGTYNNPWTSSSITYTNALQGTVSISSTSSGTSGNAHNHPITMSIEYCDLILASKN